MDKLIPKLRAILFQELQFIKPYGVDQIGYRYFLKDGRSFGLPTCKEWYQQEKDEKFYKIMKNFLSSELLKLKEQKHVYVSRASEENEYIDCLKEMKMDNSVGIYFFNEHRIDSLFFIYQDNTREKRDCVFNNLQILQKHKEKIAQKLCYVTDKIEFNDNYEFLLDTNDRKILFNAVKPLSQCKNIKIILKGQEIFLTDKEFKILKTLQNSFSNKAIASNLSISISTVEKHIFNIKNKLCIFSRDDLRWFAQTNPVINHLKIN